jgi:hypothetical protein
MCNVSLLDVAFRVLALGNGNYICSWTWTDSLDSQVVESFLREWSNCDVAHQDVGVSIARGSCENVGGQDGEERCGRELHVELE